MGGYFLGIESSCDDTGVAIFHPDQGILAERLIKQTLIHAPFGGVVPELAAREHQANLSSAVKQVLLDASLSLSQLTAIAVTHGPGLIGSLLTGNAFAASLAWGLGIPLLKIHHLVAHIVICTYGISAPIYPSLALLVSGGHTALIQMESATSYHLLSQTRDDACGEAFDKLAKLMGLGYPGGPEIERLAQDGDADAVKLTVPMRDHPGLDFSFSGLKSQAARLWLDGQVNRNDLCAAYQQAIIDAMICKVSRAWYENNYRYLFVAGGVASNHRLRQILDQQGWPVHFPKLSWCMDNGAMVAVAGALAWSSQDNIKQPPSGFSARARWPELMLLSDPLGYVKSS